MAARGCIRLLPALATGLLTVACATTTYSPEPLDDPREFASYQSKTIGDITVSVAILTDDEARRHFGADLGARGVQALWISVRNGEVVRRLDCWDSVVFHRQTGTAPDLG